MGWDVLCNVNAPLADSFTCQYFRPISGLTAAIGVQYI